MSFKKIIIPILICSAGFYLFQEKDFLTQTIDDINFSITSASLAEDKEIEKVNAKIRIYNLYPSGEAIALKKDTKLLSKSDGVVYQTIESVIVPGIKSGKPGQVDVAVEVFKKADEVLDKEAVITIPGLSSTDYFQTTWAEVIDEEEIVEEEPEAFKETKTLVSGIIDKDTIWELKNSPYIIYGNIFIPKNVTLIIEPGVEIIINGDYSFLIEGEIKMTGERKTPVTLFKSN